ncbi:hypothetical protein GCM10010256_82110 [Streptomyces coeruleorubidus]|nr:hypothetical protein GCM10010256_82110 [Streptomyces coeruleorubidus]GGU39319.1 hypothetical protein GCM10010244_76940 [Streptomyces bellus]
MEAAEAFSAPDMSARATPGPVTEMGSITAARAMATSTRVGLGAVSAGTALGGDSSESASDWDIETYQSWGKLGRVRGQSREAGSGARPAGGRAAGGASWAAR